MLTLYHGSQDIIEQPTYGIGKKYNDYGQGFYCTEHVELAKEWACVGTGNGYSNQYELDTTGLTIMDLSEERYHIMNWLAILIENRQPRLSSPISSQAAHYVLANYLPKYKGFDVIRGYRADDSYFAYARAFLSNEISLEQLSRAMMLGKLGEQIVLKSKKAFAQIRFVESELAEGKIYHAKRETRDALARRQYQELASENIFDGIFIREIMREGMTIDDLRI